MNDSREQALQIMENFIASKFSSFPVFSLAKDDDTPFTKMLILTSLRHFVFIQKILKSLILKKLSGQNPLAQSALILGAAELLYMQTPAYAVINSYVAEVKKKTDRYVGGFVNAVLRKISQNKQAFLLEDKGVFFPQNFRTLLKKDYTSKTINAIEKISAQEACLDITPLTQTTSALGGTLLPLGTIRLKSKGKISSLPDYQKGLWQVQDFSSSLAVKMLDDLSGKSILELCAAPGGKTAQLLRKNAVLTCLDISAERLKILHENLARLNLSPQSILCEDGLKFLKETKESYDGIVLDAPCSATGTLRRHPEIVFSKTAEDIEKQSCLQKRFLDLCASRLKNEGFLLYCTCSLCKAEGEHQIQSFLAEHKDFKTLSLKPKLPPELSALLTPEGWVRVLPHHLASFGGADGFFIACLKKGV